MERKDLLIWLGYRIRYFRNNLGVSQEELGQLANLHRTYIGSIERGERNISFINLVKIAKALHTEASELIKNIPNNIS